MKADAESIRQLPENFGFKIMEGIPTKSIFGILPAVMAMDINPLEIGSGLHVATKKHPLADQSSYFCSVLTKGLFSKILRQISKNQRFLYHLGSTYALLLVNMGTLFILTPTLLHTLGNEKYGIWMLLFGITNFFNLSSFGFGQTFTIELVKKRDKPKEVNKLSNTLFFSLVFFAVATLPIFLLLRYNLDWFKVPPVMMGDAGRGLWLIYIVFFLNFLSQLPYNILFACSRLGLRNGIEIGKVLLNGIVLFLILRKGGSIQELAFGTLVVTFLYVLVLFVVSRTVLTYHLSYGHFSMKQFRKFLRPGLHFFLLGLAMYLVVYSDSILVSSLKNPAMVAAYTLALRIPDVSMRLIFKISDVKVPKLMQLYQSEAWRELWLLHNRLFWLTAFAAFIVLAIMLIFGQDILSLWIGKDFVLNRTLALIFSLNMLTQCLLHVPGIILQSVGLHERSAIVAIIGAPISLVFAWWFSKGLGLEGIALAMCGSQLIIGLIAAPQFYKTMYQNLRSQGMGLNFFLLK